MKRGAPRESDDRARRHPGRQARRGGRASRRHAAVGPPRAAPGLPCLRKDCLIAPYQIDEARAFGADAVLLVVGGVTARQGADLLAAARAGGLDVLVEVHSEAELERAAGLGATLIGINNRDLATFDVSLATAERLAPRAP